MAAPMDNETTVEQVEDTQIFTENGIAICQKLAKTPLERSKVFNPRMITIREAIFGTLKVLTDNSKDVVHCVDVLAGSGIAGLQWKKHLGESVHVTIVDRDTTETLKDNCERNDIIHKELPLNFSRIPGDHMESQSSSEIHVCLCGPNVILHMEAFDFVYLNTQGNFMNYVDSAVMNLKNNGVLCLSSCDISSQFIRTPHTIRRQFSANANAKTDYMKELAVRIIIASVVRSAAKCNKGIEVLYSMCVDDFFLLCMRILRGPKFADSSVEQVRSILHCQMCEERTFFSNSNTPVEEPYKLLSCDCKENTPGKTAVILGPAWSGNLFNTTFLESMLSERETLNYSPKLHQTLQLMVEESKCGDISHPVGNGCEGEPPPMKKQKTENQCDLSSQMPPFFYNIPKRKFKGITQPKLSKLLELLYQEGYRISRTHFDKNSIRTNCSLKQLYSVLQKYFRQSH